MVVLELPLASGNQATEFGRRLLAWRKHRRLTQRALAEVAGVHYVTIARLESGAVPEPAWGVALKLAEALGVGIEAFTDGGPLPETPADPDPEPAEEERPRSRGKLK